MEWDLRHDKSLGMMAQGGYGEKNSAVFSPKITAAKNVMFSDS
jgi:hypothetical protein